jgi:ribosomal protein L11 methyltransferase
LWKVSVSIAPDAEDAVIEALTEIFGQPPAVYSDLEAHTVVASTFLPEVDARQRRRVREALQKIRGAGLDLGSGRFSVRAVRRENWAESWKRHFIPIEIGSRLLVLPSWSKKKARRGQEVVILDPGLSFGTGHHATTAFCLGQIARLRTSGSQSLLDIGAGSGILAIAAMKLGYQPVDAFDFDPDAVRVARENARVNAIRLNVSQKDLTQLPVRGPRQYHVVCANLIYDLLIAERRRIINRVRAGGTLVLAGILKGQFDAVRRSYEGEGMSQCAERADGEWKSGAFRFREERANGSRQAV